MKRLIATRKRYKAFGRGTMEFLHPENRKILAFIRRYEEETILVVANLSRLVQCFELDLSAYAGWLPVELSGGTHFPEVGDRPYFLNLGPFAFYWFALEQQRDGDGRGRSEDVPLIDARGNWEEVFADANRGRSRAALTRYIRGRRWFGGKARTIDVRCDASRDSACALPPTTPAMLALRLNIEYTDAEAETYVLPLAITQARRADEAESAKTATLIARLQDGCLLYEPVSDETSPQALLETIARRRHLKGEEGTISGTASRAFRELRGTGALDAQVLQAEQSNTAIVYGHRLFLKLFRRLEARRERRPRDEPLPQRGDASSATRRGSPGPSSIAADSTEPMTLAHRCRASSPNAGDAWTFTLDAIGRYFERITQRPSAAERVTKAMPQESRSRSPTAAARHVPR